jgi:O-antigen biosynthesis protein WbqP
MIYQAKLDGEYVEKIGFAMDVKCFFETILSVIKSDGVVEGKTESTLKSNNEVTTKKEILNK